MWQGIVTTLVTGGLLAVLGDRLARGSKQWRDLSRARQELEVAALVTHDQGMADRLRGRADERVERYLKPRRWESPTVRTRVLITTLDGLVIALVAVLGLAIVGVDAGSKFWVQVGIGAAAAISGFAVTAWVRPRLEASKAS